LCMLFHIRDCPFPFSFHFRAFHSIMDPYASLL
jgi:hypothetical protein